MKTVGNYAVKDNRLVVGRNSRNLKKKRAVSHQKTARPKLTIFTTG